MKRVKIKICLIILLLLIGLLEGVFSQSWDGDRRNDIWSLWQININAGITSYYGDLSMFDYTMSDKIFYESGPAVSFILSKQLSNAFGISGQLISGKLKGSNYNNSFESNLYEYNLHVRLNVINAFFTNKITKFGIIGFAGIGQFLFKTKSYKNDDGLFITETHNTGVPEFIFFYGAGICYNITNNFGITADISLRHCQNDKLDNYVKNHDFDYYTYACVGISYKINSIIKPPPRNKARLAHNTRLLKPLKQ